MTPRFRVFLTKFLRDSAGGVLVYAAIAAQVVIGAAALPVAIGLWYANKGLARSAADSPRRFPSFYPRALASRRGLA